MAASPLHESNLAAFGLALLTDPFDIVKPPLACALGAGTAAINLLPDTLVAERSLALQRSRAFRARHCGVLERPVTPYSRVSAWPRQFDSFLET